ncbi:uncharacterized protein LOC128992927 [Macrosteles quadrilineatus]|uniref:uncharacterized protein LOC128992927 n=1 Tax=Macrosteles quadrilineatus TaxID=74068 RepID=UPI0023E0D72C|nr:uncharacterized protein LOC128992927 [Macrosteles quadrilineatus]
MESPTVGIDDLPDEILCVIFSYLNPGDVVKNVIRVCKRWEVVVNENNMWWKNVQFTVYIDSFIGYSFITEKPTSIRLWVEEDWNQIMIGEKDLNLVPNVQCIKFIGGRTESEKCYPVQNAIRILDVLRKTCKNIVKFEFERCFGMASKEFVELLCTWYENIKEIRYGMSCSYIIPYKNISTFKSLTTLVAHDYAFKHFDLSCLADGCEMLNSLWILFARSPKVDDVLNFLEKKKHILKELGIGSIIQDCILEKLKECCCLEVLFVTDARFVTDGCIRSFYNLPKLKYFSLHRARFEPQTVYDIVRAGPSGLFSQLFIFDLTNYRYESNIFSPKDAINGDRKMMFENNISTAIAVPWTVKSPLHWMYRSEKVQRYTLTDQTKIVVGEPQTVCGLRVQPTDTQTSHTRRPPTHVKKSARRQTRRSGLEALGDRRPAALARPGLPTKFPVP